MKIKKSTKKFLQKRKATHAGRKENHAAIPKKRVVTKSEETKLDSNHESESDQSIHDGGFPIPENIIQSQSEDEDEDEKVDDLDHFELNSDNDSLLDDETHKSQMEALKEKDPTFYNFLLKNDPALLEFNETPEKHSIEENPDLDADESCANVTEEMILEWTKSIQKHSLLSLKEMLICLKSIATIDDEDNMNLKYRVEPDSKASTLVLMTTIKYASIIFDHKLGVQIPESKLPSTNKKWKKIHVLVKSFLTTIIKLLTQMTDLTILRFILKSTEDFISYFASFPKLCKEYLKILLNFWSTSNDQLKILSFLCIRKLALTCPNPYLDIILKVISFNFRNLIFFLWTLVKLQIVTNGLL
jgi:nucleolar complex protein 2